MGCPKSLFTKIHLLRSGNQDFAHLVPERPGQPVTDEGRSRWIHRRSHPKTSRDNKIILLLLDSSLQVWWRKLTKILATLAMKSSGIRCLKYLLFLVWMGCVDLQGVGPAVAETLALLGFSMERVISSMPSFYLSSSRSRPLSSELVAPFFLPITF